MSLDRFKSAQESPHDGFAGALAQLQAGRKTSHWIWYIFPQLAGLGHSSTARHYALRDAAEARAYLADPVLRERLLAAITAVTAHLESGRELSAVMGSEVDALKLVSCLTLFDAVARDAIDPASAAVGRACADGLRLAGTQGYAVCGFTQQQLQR
jgi:uncharacterized protein (DUF1810 family)